MNVEVSKAAMLVLEWNFTFHGTSSMFSFNGISCTRGSWNKKEKGGGHAAVVKQPCSAEVLDCMFNKKTSEDSDRPLITSKTSHRYVLLLLCLLPDRPVTDTQQHPGVRDSLLWSKCAEHPAPHPVCLSCVKWITTIILNTRSNVVLLHGSSTGTRSKNPYSHQVTLSCLYTSHCS